MDEHMMRHLCHAKRIDNGAWVEGSLVYSKDIDEEHKAIIIPLSDNGICEATHDELLFREWYAVDPATICRSIGMTDKNGRLICENDIVYDPEEGKLYQVVFDQEEMTYYLLDRAKNRHYFDVNYGISVCLVSNAFDMGPFCEEISPNQSVTSEEIERD